MFPAIQTNLLRQRGKKEHSRVTYLELFFDLVFVFAVTQISHFLLENLTVMGSLHTLILILAVWWVWVFTSWVTNWLDPEKTPVRMLLLVLMLGGLVMSASLPQAFGDMGMVFAGSFVFMQVGRSLFTLLAVKKHHDTHYRSFQRITAWLAVSGIFWIAGGLCEGTLRLGLWVAALTIEYLGPFCAFWVPVLGGSKTKDWEVEGGHMSERCALFIIIALGESILVTGTTFAGLDWSSANIAAFLSAFTGSIALWWIYFDTGMERGAAEISHSRDPGKLARQAYTYIHAPIVAGIIVSAVGDELVLTHPEGHSAWVVIAVILSGPALFIGGNLLFKHAITGKLPPSHLAGLTILALSACAAPLVPPLALSFWTTGVLMAVAVWEMVSRGEGIADAEI